MNFFISIMIKHFLSIPFLWALVIPVSAQLTEDMVKKNPALSSGNYIVYENPTGKLTPAPKGYTPFYISHYGRHGSRYMISSSDAKESWTVLDQADLEGKLTKKGQEVRDMLHKVVVAMDDRSGELTPLGHTQHIGIATRMFNNYSQVFAQNAKIDAKATTVVRCVLSMSSFCQQLKALNPKLNITTDASHHDMYYMVKNKDESHKAPDSEVKTKRAHEKFCDSLTNSSRVMSLLFKEKTYLNKEKSDKLARSIFNVACDLQDMPNIDFELYSLFSSTELYNYWQMQNAWWFTWTGLYSLQDEEGPRRGCNLLKNILDEAQAAIDNNQPAASLRFGHDTGLMPLLALMKIDNCGVRCGSMDSVAKVWNDVDIVPMAANIQFVFYHKPGEKDVLLKVLRNEKEAKLPFETDNFPFYKWSDFKNYYSKLVP